MDPRTGDFVLVGGMPYRRPLLDAEWVLRRFPHGRRRRLTWATPPAR